MDLFLPPSLSLPLPLTAHFPPPQSLSPSLSPSAHLLMYSAMICLWSKASGRDSASFKGTTRT